MESTESANPLVCRSEWTLLDRRMTRHALILAGTEGIGLAAAKAIGQAGAQITLMSRDESKVAKAVAELVALGVEAHGQAVDLQDRVRFKAFLDSVSQRSPIDILVNNQGGPPSGNFSSFESADFTRATENYAEPFLTAIAHVLPSMKERGFGRIVTVASLSAILPLDNLDLSNFVRGGLLNLHKTLSRAVAASGVTVNMVLPGSIETERSRKLITERATKKGVTFESERALAAERIPMKRLGSPDEMGAAIAFLASDAASYITGVALPVDGGLYPAT